MEELLLNAQPREELGKSKVHALRRDGFIPAVVYKEGKASQPIKVSHKELLGLIHQHRIEGAVISLKLNGQGKDKPLPCIIKEIQYNPVDGEIAHVDFNEISLTKAIKVSVPVVAVGEPTGVKQEGGSLEHILWQIEVECLPADIPQQITVEVSALKIGDSVHIRDIAFSPKVKVLNEPGAIVLSVAAPIKEEVAPPAVEGEVSQEPEVIKEKKEAPAEETAEPEPKEKKKQE
jgi:large subunit ribosomal protein L25